MITEHNYTMGKIKNYTITPEFAYIRLENSLPSQAYLSIFHSPGTVQIEMSWRQECKWGTIENYPAS